MILSSHPLFATAILVGLNNPLFPALKLFTGTNSNEISSFFIGEIGGTVAGLVAKTVLKDSTQPYAAVALSAVAGSYCFKNIYNSFHNKSEIGDLVMNQAQQALDTTIEATKEVYTQATQISSRIYNAATEVTKEIYTHTTKYAISSIEMAQSIKCGTAAKIVAVGTVIATAYFQPEVAVKFVKYSLLASVCTGTVVSIVSNKDAIADKAHDLYDYAIEKFFPEAADVAGAESNHPNLD